MTLLKSEMMVLKRKAQILNELKTGLKSD